MKRTPFPAWPGGLIAIVVLVLLGVPAALPAQSKVLPNIVLFLCDDLGYADVGCYGHPYARTPAIDGLAAEGVRFEQHYVTGVTCNPSRTGLMTGLYPARFPKYAADFGFDKRTTITELLQQHGYRTGHFGKWHIGPKSTERNGMYGIDVVEVIGKSGDRQAGRDDDLTTAAIEFMRESAGKQPFYLNIWGHSTHFPVTVPDRLSGVFAGQEVRRGDFSRTMQHKFDECLQIGGDLDESMQQYLGDVYSIDRNVGRLLAAIDELGIRDNTLFVFSSDHGPAPVILGKQGAREFSNNMLGYAGIYRGGKHELYEGGTRVPMILRWPGRIEPGRVDSESVTSFIDWMPTLASIAGIDQLPDQMDGEDISDIWFGSPRPRANPLFWKASASGAAPVIRHGTWKLHAANRGREAELYDLSEDPAESRNVAGQHPKIVADLMGRLDDWTAELPKAYEKADKDRGREKRERTSGHAKGEAGNGESVAERGVPPLPKFTFQGVALHPKDLRYTPTDQLIHPAIIKTEGRIENALGKYYLYYAPHKHIATSMVYSDSMDGPWTEYPGNPVVEGPSAPEVRWIEEHGKFFLWGHRKNSQTELWTSEDGIHFEHDSVSITARAIGTRNATYNRVYEFPLEEFGSRYIMLYSGFIEERGIRCVWLAHSRDAKKWVQLETPLVEPVEGEHDNLYGPSLLQWNGRNFIVYQDQTAWRGGNLKAVEVNRGLDPVGAGGERLVLVDPPADPPLKDRYRGAEFYREGETLYLYSSASKDPRILVYATAKLEHAAPALQGRKRGEPKSGKRGRKAPGAAR